MKKRKQVYTMGVIYVKKKEQDVQQRTEAYSSASIPEWRGEL